VLDLVERPDLLVGSGGAGLSPGAGMSPMRWRSGEVAVGASLQPPAALVDRAVMGAAQQGQVGQVGGAAIQPVAQVVGLVTPGVVEERDIPLMW
jgi:hypothetical protein